MRRRVARTQALLDAPYLYEHLSKHRSKAKTGRTGSNDQTGAPRPSCHYQLAYDVKLHRPVRGHSRRALGAGWTRRCRPAPTRVLRGNPARAFNQSQRHSSYRSARWRGAVLVPSFLALLALPSRRGQAFARFRRGTSQHRTARGHAPASLLTSTRHAAAARRPRRRPRPNAPRSRCGPTGRTARSARAHPRPRLYPQRPRRAPRS